MKRHVIRGLVMLGLFATAAATVSAQNALDSVEVRNRKDGSTKIHSGQFKVTPAGFQVFSGEKFDKASEAFAPDDIIKVTINELPGVDPTLFRAARDKENKKGATTKDYTDARDGYKALAKSNLAPRSKRYLDFKVYSINHKLVDELDAGKEWEGKADKAISDWKGFLDDYKDAFGWEIWPAVRSITRLQIERNKYDDAAAAWAKIRGIADLPPEPKLEAGLQEIDLRIRSKTYPTAAALAEGLLKTAAGSRKERLAIYLLAAKAGSDSKYVEGVEKIKAEMEKTKDPTVHATGYAMMGELYLAGGKFRDAMWMFLWVETVVNQDKDEVFKAISRLAELFEKAPMDEDPNKKPLADEEQAKKYREKLKRYRTTF